LAIAASFPFSYLNIRNYYIISCSTLSGFCSRYTEEVSVNFRLVFLSYSVQISIVSASVMIQYGM
jgi:hypothetical protein